MLTKSIKHFIGLLPFLNEDNDIKYNNLYLTEIKDDKVNDIELVFSETKVDVLNYTDFRTSNTDNIKVFFDINKKRYLLNSYEIVYKNQIHLYGKFLYNVLDEVQIATEVSPVNQVSEINQVSPVNQVSLGQTSLITNLLSN